MGAALMAFNPETAKPVSSFNPTTAKPAADKRQRPLEPKQADAAEGIAGNPATRFALGAGRLLSGPFQLGANVGDKIAESLGYDPVVGKATNEWLKRLEGIKERGMEARGDSYDVAGLGGEVLAGGGILKRLGTATSAIGRVAKGAAGGGIFGAAQPVTGGDDFAGTKAVQIAGGGFVGGAVPGAIGIARGITKAVGEVGDLIVPGGAGRIATRFQREITGGPEQIKKVADALRAAPELVPGSRPTAAEVLTKMPEGSPLISHQKVTARTAGGISARFGRQKIDAEAARQEAMKYLSAKTAPLREAALESANKGGVKSGPILGRIAEINARPGIGASDVVSKTLGAIQSKIHRLAKGGVINAEDLYTVRKEIGSTIKTFSKETANWDKRLASGLERDVQGIIDDAIEGAGGKGWKEYLSVYSAGRNKIRVDEERAKKMFRVLQPTSLQGGQNVAEETRSHIPQLLSRPAMIANAILRRLGYAIEPRVDAVMADRYLDPKLLADALENAPPPQWRAILSQMNKQLAAGQLASVGAPAAVTAEALGE